MKIAIITFLLLATAAFGSNVKSCYLRFYQWEDEGVFFTDVTGNLNASPATWTFPDPPSDGSQTTFSSIRSVTVDEDFHCDDVCKLTVYSRPAFGGRSEVYYPGVTGEAIFPTFCIKSYSLDCGPYVPGEEIEEEEEEQQ